ncbi:hypothetical protein G7Y89_g6797 [Cudoniella acicularis]|uniref:Uncharacterized protein n=1 Tax=Cudoniella acicularis TaxID=354080 RepID=A0A8H4RM12_9HELO|nr:hypothetical protein G7Y89_g6797 [Cudoniella acicularis]
MAHPTKSLPTSFKELVIRLKRGSRQGKQHASSPSDTPAPGSSADPNLIIPKSRLSLFSLPPETRLEIYFYALLNAWSTSRYRPDLVQIPWSISDPYHTPTSHSSYAVFVELTRSLTVSKQMHAEVEKLFYERFTFQWPAFVCACAASKYLPKRSIGAQNWMRNIELRLILQTETSQTTSELEIQRHRGFFLVLKAGLPSLRRVAITILLLGTYVNPEWKAQLITSAVGLVSIFREIEILDLHHRYTSFQEQKFRVVEEIIEKVETREWEEFPELDGEFKCCSRTRKKQLSSTIMKYIRESVR